MTAFWGSHFCVSNMSFAKICPHLYLCYVKTKPNFIHKMFYIFIECFSAHICIRIGLMIKIKTFFANKYAHC